MMGHMPSMGSDEGLNGTFCVYGGMNLGFATAGSEIAPGCVVFLFENWVLDTPKKYAFAVVGTYFLAMLPEALHWLRQRKIAKMRPERRRMRFWAHAFAYFLQVTITYWLMLIVMAYSTYLFLAIPLGFTTSHMLFAYKGIAVDHASGCGLVESDKSNVDDASIERELLEV